VWIGPEGDFSDAEYEAITRSGALPITLGSLVLRVETAATYCLSVMNYEMRSPDGARTALFA
jgi:16S rRNA (uracil1498-N3)-methyltransferase